MVTSISCHFAIGFYKLCSCLCSPQPYSTSGPLYDVPSILQITESQIPSRLMHRIVWIPVFLLSLFVIDGTLWAVGQAVCAFLPLLLSVEPVSSEACVTPSWAFSPSRVPGVLSKGGQMLRDLVMGQPLVASGQAWSSTQQLPPPSPITGAGFVYSGGGGLLALRPTQQKKILTQNLAEGKPNLNKRPFVGPPQTPPPYILIPYKQLLHWG